MLISLKLLSRKNHFFFQCKQLEIQLFKGFVFKACIFNFFNTLNRFQATMKDTPRKTTLNCELFKVCVWRFSFDTDTTNYYFFLQERQLFGRFIKMLSSSKLGLGDSYLHPIIFKEQYISFLKQKTYSCYWKQCLYKNKKSIVNTIIKSVETGFFCWN